ncbi:MAG TPA: preprotein translocase subunit SecE [Verrucomicrobiae bacterium]
MKNFIFNWVAAIAATVLLALPAGAQTVMSNAANNAAVTVTNAATPGTTTNAAAQTAARAAKGSGYTGLIIWGAILLGVFAFLWSKGYLVRIRNYVDETKEELRKCSWPSREELRGSTVVVMVTIALLGLFTVGVDWILSGLIRLII